MDFAKKQLEKYGWSEGKGLGKNEDGIAKAIKPKLKFDHTGIGHDIGTQFTNNWWENAYNNALNNIQINKEENGEIQMSLKNGELIEITTNNNSLKQLKKQNVHLEYGSFLKTSKLTSKGIIGYNNATKILESSTVSSLQILTDEELFAACGGRTAHKSARHGLKLSGKLSRIEKQEKLLLKKLQNVTICDERKEMEKKVKKIAKHKDRHKPTDMEESDIILGLEDDSRSSTSSSSRRRKKKRERKSVSFNETVTEYHMQDVESNDNDSNETAVVHTFVEKSKIKDEEPNNVDINILDEGIEQDIEGKHNNNDEEDCDHKSFEEAQCSNPGKLSKLERKLMKKNTATFRFLQEVNKSEIDEETLVDIYDGCKKCKKRKHNIEGEEIEDGMVFKKYCENEVSNRKKEKKRIKEKKWKLKKREEKKINSITMSLDQVCKISDKD